MDALLPQSLSLTRQESGQWKGSVVAPQDDKALDRIKDFAAKHHLLNVIPRGRKTLTERQDDYLRRSKKLGRKKLAVFIEHDVAQDLEYLSAIHGTQKAAVEISIREKAARVRKKNNP